MGPETALEGLGGSPEGPERPPLGILRDGTGGPQRALRWPPRGPQERLSLLWTGPSHPRRPRPPRAPPVLAMEAMGALPDSPESSHADLQWPVDAVVAGMRMPPPMCKRPRAPAPHSISCKYSSGPCKLHGGACRYVTWHVPCVSICFTHCKQLIVSVHVTYMGLVCWLQLIRLIVAARASGGGRGFGGEGRGRSEMERAGGKGGRPRGPLSGPHEAPAGRPRGRGSRRHERGLRLVATLGCRGTQPQRSEDCSDV